MCSFTFFYTWQNFCKLVFCNHPLCDHRRELDRGLQPWEQGRGPRSSNLNRDNFWMYFQIHFLLASQFLFLQNRLMFYIYLLVLTALRNHSTKSTHCLWCLMYPIVRRRENGAGSAKEKGIMNGLEYFRAYGKLLRPTLSLVLPTYFYYCLQITLQKCLSL